MNREQQMMARRRQAAHSKEDRFCIALGVFSLLAVAIVPPGEEQAPVIRTEAHRAWVAEQCTRAQTETEARQCAAFFRGRK